MMNCLQSGVKKNKIVLIRSQIMMRVGTLIKGVVLGKHPYIYCISWTAQNILKLPKSYLICIPSWPWISMKQMNILVSENLSRNIVET